MTSLTRRTLLKSAVAAPVAMAIPHVATAQTTTLLRYDLASPKGQEMLVIYADAVRAMEALGPENPMGWLWHWYTHFVDSRTTKADEITRIFGDTPSPLRTLAEEMWNTCQSHAGQNPNHFLPWHRIYVYYFERICREVTGRADFTLPFWDYTSTDPAKCGIVPVEFRSPGDPVFDCLYRAERSELANTGEPLHKNQPTNVMDIDDIMRKTAYSSAGSVMGFCRSVDSGIHGRLHVLIGNRLGMGTVPYSGRDPLFWVHHSNIDRMWASWNRYGGKNPSGTTWGQTYFVFADANGVRRRRKLSDFFGVLANGYTYDTFIPKPVDPPADPDPVATVAAPPGATLAAGAMLAAVAVPGDGNDSRGTERREPVDTKRRAATVGGLLAAAVSADVAAASKAEEVVARGGNAVKLGGLSGASVDLLPAAGTRATRVLGLDPSHPTKRTYLVLKDLHAWSQPEVLFHVYLRPGNGAGKLDKATYAGNINFFDAEFHDHGNGALGDALGENFYSFDVTEILRDMGRKNLPAASSSLRVTIVPAGIPTNGSEPLVATIALVRQ